MRYGENPHQTAAFYGEIEEGRFHQGCGTLNGKELSFNNINDTNGALGFSRSYGPTVVACKHGNPCGVGSADNIYDAWKKPMLRTGINLRIVVLNRKLRFNSKGNG